MGLLKRRAAGASNAATGPRLAIIAGGGRLPVRLAEAEPGAFLVSFEGTPCELPEARLTRFRFEKLGGLFDRLRAEGVERIVMAGGMARPQLDMKQVDRKVMMLAPKLMAALGSKGDDGVLRLIVSILEDEGFAVEGAHQILPEMTARPGKIGGPALSRAARGDVEQAQKILSTLAPLDIGQGCVVAAGQCLGIETVQGTDALLRFVGETPEERRPGKGVLVKAPKAGQDLRVDMPAVGPQTLRAAAAAGLEAVVIAADRVLLIDGPALPDLAAELGLAFHAVEI